MQRYLVPILRSPTSTENLQQFWIFLEQNGLRLLTVEGDDATAVGTAHEFCELNDLTLTADPFCAGPFVFAPIDPTDKDLSAFYSWSETPPTKSPSCEAWRPFLWVRTSASTEIDPWGVNALLDKIPLGDQPAATAYSLLRSYLEASRTP